MSRDFDVVIVGAGPVGSVMGALLMARRLTAPGRVALVAQGACAAPAAREAAAAGGAATSWAPWGLRVFALSRASERLLRLCGAWERLPARLKFPYERMCVWDENGVPGGRGSLTFDCAELGEPDLGAIVDGQALNESCLQAAGAAGVVCIDAQVEALELTEREARIELGDGRELGAKLVIGADGAGSRTRSLLGIATGGHSYHQDALVAHIRTGEPHRSTAWQRFLSTGPLAFLPLSDGRSSIVWSVNRGEAERLRALSPEDFAQAVQTAGAGVLGAVELTTQVGSFPLQLQYALDYVRPRAALVGDAAHVVHPLAGQGLNLGLLDCAALAGMLEGSRGALGEYAALRRYERSRKSENLLTATFFDGLERLFSNSHATLMGLRAAGLESVGRLGFMRRRLARRALGIDGDIPDFVKNPAR